ncbi:MAG: ABC transporter permease [Thermincola sp.]|jgi:NitT/TauT family transport system permease protein|nr:ABC transporter permease [Thermincola sp.]MDT3702588.1 ABC transporter permease [Thermincola sp.]
MNRQAEKIFFPLITIAFLMVLWNWMSGLFPADLLPKPWAVVISFWEMKDILHVHISVSLLRFLGAYLAAALLAIPLGLIFGRYARLWLAFEPLAHIIRPISPVAWLPLMVLWFGIGNLPTMVIIFIAAFFPILLTTISAVRNVDPVYLKVARNFNTGELNVLRKVIVPAAFPNITVGLHLALGTGWVFLVVGEMLGVQSGLGYLIIDGRNSLRYDMVIASMLMIGVIGLLFDRLITLFEKWVRGKWGYVTARSE